MTVAETDLPADPSAEARAELEARIRRGRLKAAADLRADFPAVWEDPEARLELVYAEFVLRRANGERPNREDWFERYPDMHERLERLFGLYDLMAGDTQQPEATVGGGRPSAEPPPDAGHPGGYEVLGEIGRGGMAVVYRARHLVLNRAVALKVLHWGNADAACDARRVRREAELVARIQHPHIVQVYEVGEWDGDPFLALEFVPGGTLADALARLRHLGRTGVSADDAAALVGLLAGAVQAAHGQGVVHRDLKPANVLLADDPAGPFVRPKIADFGLAISTDVSTLVSQTAAVVGTPCYMAPEQADGRRAAVGPRTDVYALGGILYELLTGRPPFQGATVLETLDLVRHADPVPPRRLRPDLPRDLETICLTCLGKDPARRYESAAALADDLARFRDGRPILARPVGPWEKAWKWCRRRPVIAGLTAVAVLLAAGVVAGIVNNRRAEEFARQREELVRADLDAASAREAVAAARDAWDGDRADEAARLLEACPPPYRDESWHQLKAEVSALVSSVPVAVTPATTAIQLSTSGRFVIFRGSNTVTIVDAGGTFVGQIRNTNRRNFDTFFSEDDARFSYHEAFPLVPLVKGASAYADRVPDPEPRILRTIDIRSRNEVASRPVPCRPGATSRTGLRVEIASPTTLAVVRLATGERLRTIDVAAHGRFQSMMFDPAQGRLATFHPDAVAVHDLERGTIRAFRFTPPAKSRASKLNPDLRTIYLILQPEEPASGNAAWHLCAWDTESNRERFRIRRRPEHEGSLLNIAVSPSGSLVAVGWGPQIDLYHARTGERLAGLRGHKSYVPVFAFAADGKRLVSFAQDRLLRTWDVSPWDKSASDE